MTAMQFLEMSASVSLQAALLIGFCRWLTGWTSSDLVRCRIWTNCQFGLLALVIIACSLPHFRLLHSEELINPHDILAAVHRQTTWGTWLFSIWAVGAAISALQIVFSCLRLMIFLKSLKPLAEVPALILQQSLHLPACFPVRVYVCDALISPFCWQFQQPVLVLPRTHLDLESGELELILKHELAHLKSNHPLHLFIQRVVQCIFWFHPVVHWCGRQAELSREMMCDAATAQHKAEISSYLRVLLKLAERESHRKTITGGLGLSFFKDHSALTKRARRLAERGKQLTASTPPRTWLSAGVLLLTGLLTIVWLPVNLLSSNRSNWSACPIWTAEILHNLGVPTRDYEIYEGRLQIFDRESDVPGLSD